ncbi:uncharacterized protein [Mytilus edulis]|uniref:uncharacterized protein n=1 Tax=Mytilus edulis TaxID=6550 RepID=UPI0039F14E6D
MQHRHTSRCTRNFPRFINVAILGAFIILLTVIGTDKCRDLFSSTTNIENAPEDTHKARDQGFIARHSLATTTSQKLTNLSKQHASKEQNKKGNGLKVDMNDRKKPNETTNWIEAFKELARDLRKDDYFCQNKVERGQLKFDCNTSPFVVLKPCLVYSFG